MSSSGIMERKYNGWSADLFASSVMTFGRVKHIYLAGLAANDADSGAVVHVGDVREQTRLTYRKVKDALAQHGATLADVVKITAYALDRSALPEYSQARLEAFGDTPLCPHTFLVVSGLAFPEMLIEVDVVAVVAE